MPNPRIAARYAKSLIDLAEENNQLEAVYADIKYLQEVCKSSREFVTFLRSPVIKPDKKDAIIAAITKDSIGTLVSAFTRLLVRKGREEDLPEIISAFINQYNHIKDIHRVKLTTAVGVSEQLKNAIVSKIQSEAGLPNIELEAKVDEALIGGFVLEFNNNLVDASVLRDLKDIKKQFNNNEYVRNIR